MTAEALIARYGLLAVFAGTFFEGETVLVLAGFAAHRGYLELSGVMTAAFLGAFVGDSSGSRSGAWVAGASWPVDRRGRAGSTARARGSRATSGR